MTTGFAIVMPPCCSSKATIWYGIHLGYICFTTQERSETKRQTSRLANFGRMQVSVYPPGSKEASSHRHISRGGGEAEDDGRSTSPRCFRDEQVHQSAVRIPFSLMKARNAIGDAGRGQTTEALAKFSWLPDLHKTGDER